MVGVEVVVGVGIDQKKKIFQSFFFCRKNIFSGVITVRTGVRKELIQSNCPFVPSQLCHISPPLVLSFCDWIRPLDSYSRTIFIDTYDFDSNIFVN